MQQYKKNFITMLGTARLAEELIAKGGNINFIRWEAGSVLPESGKGMEHMASFDYGYKIAAVRDWLFRQSK